MGVCKSVNYKPSKYHLWLCVPILISYIFDHVLTLMGQSNAYWAGDYTIVNELNMLANWFLRIHPFAFVLFSIIVFFLYAAIIVIIPLKFAKTLSIYLVMAHTYGGFHWLKYTFNVEYSIRFGLLIIPTVLLMYVFEKVDSRTTTKDFKSSSQNRI
jgi:hypothetical protein